MNNEIHAAKDVTKTNTISVDTFKSLGYVIGIVSNNEVIFHRNSMKGTF